jgi:AcrR family transcriptional regulator
MPDTVERRRRLKPEQRRELIVQAAAEEFGRNGHRAARMEDIARAAGVTKAVLYDHFPDKGALHAAVVTGANNELLNAVAAAALQHDEPRERFRTALRTSFEIIAVRPDVRMLLLGEPGAPADVTKASNRAQRQARKAMAGLYLSEPRFLAGRPDREERAEHIALAVIGLVNALAALGVEKKLTPDYLTDLAMQILDPGMATMAGMPVVTD